MKVEIINSKCIITKEAGDPKFSGRINAAGESRLLYHIKGILNKQGYDLIKKRMHKDGHLVDDLQQYLRARKRSGDQKKDIYIYNGMWSIRGAEEYLNEMGTVTLTVLENIFEK
jgi:hypothetical protein